MKFVCALLLVVATVHANSSLNRYGWAAGKESVYQFESQVLNGVPEINRGQHAGLVLKSQVRVQSFSDYSLRIKMENVKFRTLNGDVELTESGRVQGHSGSEGGHIPESYMRFLQQPFLVHHKSGVVTSFLVAREEPSAVTNIKRSVLAQLQLDVAGTQRSQLESNHIQLPTPEESEVSGQSGLSGMSYFYTQEESVHGKCRTSYSVNRLPAYKVKELEEQWAKEEQQMKGGRQGEYSQSSEQWSEQSKSEQGKNQCEGKPYYQIIKIKDFDHCETSPIFQKWTGISGRCNLAKPSTCAGLVFHSSTSTYFVCGELSQFQIRKIQTENIIKNNPIGFKTDETFRSTTQINLELLKVKSISERLPIPSETKEEQSIVYAYPQQKEQQGKISEEILKESWEILGVRPMLPQPGLTEAPKTLLPFTIPRESIKSQAFEQLKKMAAEVSQSPESCTSKSDIAGTMASVAQNLRHLSLDELKQLEQEIREHSMQQQQGQQGQAEGQQGQELMPLEKLFWDTISGVGTNPSTMLIIRKVKQGSLPTGKTVKIVQHAIRNVRYPTQELLRELVGLAKSQTVKSNRTVLSVVLAQLSDLFYRAYVNPSHMINNFPSQLYGVFGTRHSQVLTEEFIPFLTALAKGQESGVGSESDKQYLQYSAVACLGRTGHIKAAMTLFKIGEGKIQEVEAGSQEQRPEEGQILRPLAIHSLKRSARMNPTYIKPLLMATIENPAEAPEVRTAAVAVLPFAQPTPNDIQALAIRSWFEPCRQVANFIRSTLYSLSETQVPEFKPISDYAIVSLPVMKKYDAGFMYSRNMHFSQYVEYLRSGVITGLQLQKSKQSMIPLRIAETMRFYEQQGAFKVGGFSWEAYLQGMDKIVEKYVKYFTYAGKASEQTRQQLQQIAEQLGIQHRGFQPAQFFGKSSILGIQYDSFLDTETVMNAFGKLSREAEQGEKTLSFNTVGGAIWQEASGYAMTDAGFPVYNSIAFPIVYSAKGHVKVTNEPGFQGGMPLPEVEASLTPVFNVKAQSSMGVICPFTKELIGTGVEASIHSSIPIAVKAKVNRGELEVVIRNPTEVETNGRETETLHGFVLPYTFKTSLLSVKPTSKASDMRKILDGTPRMVEIPIGHSVGLSGKLIAQSNNVYSDFSSYLEKIRQTSLFSLPNVLIIPSSIRMSSTKVKYNPGQSSTKELQFRLQLWTHGHGPKQMSGSEIESGFNSVKSVLEKVKASQQGKATLFTLSASTKGQYSSKSLKSSFIIGKSSQHNENIVKTFAALNFKTGSDSEVYGFQYNGEATMAQPKNRWNLEQLIQEDLSVEYNGKFEHGKAGQEHKIQFSGKMMKSQEQKQSVEQSPEYKKCQQEMQEGRKLTEVCREARIQAASLDKFEFEVKRVPSSFRRCSFWNLVREIIESSLIGQISYEQGSEMSGLRIKGEVDRKGYVAQAKVHTPSGEILRIQNIRLAGYTKNFFPLAVHNSAQSNLGQRLSLNRVPVTCAVEPRFITTFDNKTYGYQINDCEHLLLQDGSKNFPIAVLARSLESGSQKEVRIISGELEVKVTPQGGSATIKVNGNEQQLTPGQYKKIESSEGSYVQVEMKRYHDNTYWLNFPQQSLSVVYDGKRIEVVGSGLVWSRAVGLCGDMNGENTADLKSPRKCVMTPKIGAVSYILNKSGSSAQGTPRCQGIPSKYQQRYQKESQQCLKERVVPTPLEELFSNIKNIAIARTKNHVVDKQTGQVCLSKQMLKVCEGKPLKLRQRVVEFACIARPSEQAQSLEQRALAGEPLTAYLKPLPTVFSKAEQEPVLCSQPPHHGFQGQHGQEW